MRVPNLYAPVDSVFQCSSASRKFLNAFRHDGYANTTQGFSALQRAENSSIVPMHSMTENSDSFSALQRAENSSIQLRSCCTTTVQGFSALQRAENSSITNINEKGTTMYMFQCSSASRKFLNVRDVIRMLKFFSVSVLFSEPKIPQSRTEVLLPCGLTVSVLFSEPKIPQ